MSNCFENVPHEALDFCPNDENAAGIATRLLYIPTEFLEKLDIPTPTGDFATRVTIPEANLVIKSTKSFKGIDVLLQLFTKLTILIYNTRDFGSITLINKKGKVGKIFKLQFKLG